MWPGDFGWAGETAWIGDIGGLCGTGLCGDIERAAAATAAGGSWGLLNHSGLLLILLFSFDLADISDSVDTRFFSVNTALGASRRASVISVLGSSGMSSCFSGTAVGIFGVPGLLRSDPGNSVVPGLLRSDSGNNVVPGLLRSEPGKRFGDRGEPGTLLKDIKVWRLSWPRVSRTRGSTGDSARKGFPDRRLSHPAAPAGKNDNDPVRSIGSGGGGGYIVVRAEL